MASDTETRGINYEKRLPTTVCKSGFSRRCCQWYRLQRSAGHLFRSRFVWKRRRGVRLGTWAGTADRRRPPSGQGFWQPGCCGHLQRWGNRQVLPRQIFVDRRRS